MSKAKNSNLGEEVIREGSCSVHTSRTMMLAELTTILDQVSPDAGPNAYLAAIVEDNSLGKPTQATRRRTSRRLVELYGLDPRSPLFRLLRKLWAADVSSRPMLAYVAATARDPLLREMAPFVVATPIGLVMTPGQIADQLEDRYPARFQASTSMATAQRLASTWTQAGLLLGKVKKIRTNPVVTPLVVTIALAIGWLSGLRGRLLLESSWTRLLDRATVEVAGLTSEASQQGWLTYKSSGSVVEVAFPGLLESGRGGPGHVSD